MYEIACLGPVIFSWRYSSFLWLFLFRSKSFWTVFTVVLLFVRSKVSNETCSFVCSFLLVYFLWRFYSNLLCYTAIRVLQIFTALFYVFKKIWKEFFFTVILIFIKIVTVINLMIFFVTYQYHQLTWWLFSLIINITNYYHLTWWLFLLIIYIIIYHYLIFIFFHYISMS